MGNVTSTLDIVLKDDVTRNAAQIEGALKKIAGEAKAVDGVLASSGASAKFGASLKRIGANVTQVTAATKALKDYAAAESLSANRSDWTKAQASGFRAMEGVIVSGTKQIMAAERALEEQRARAASERQRDLVADQRARARAFEQDQRLQHRAVEQREHAVSHHGIVNYALQSAAMAVSAHGMVHVGREAWEQGAELQRERIGLQNAGRTPEEIREIEHAARGVQASTPTSGFIESLKTVAETTAAFGSVQHAIENLPFISKMTSILKTAGGDNIHGSASQLGQAFAKTFEQRQTKPEEFEAEAKQMIPAMVATGGTFNPEQLYAFAQQAKSALPSLSMRFLSRIAPSLIGAQGGDRAGTGLKAFEDVIAGKVNDKKQAEEFLKLGLLDPKMAVMKAGHAVGWKSGAVKDTFLAMTDPLAWSEQYLIPALKKQGVDTSNREATQMILNTMFRNQNANMFATEIAQEASRHRLHKDEDLFNKVGNFDEIYARNLQDFGVAAGALKSALGNLAGAVTAPLMSKAAVGLTFLASQINHLSNLALEHPTLAATGGVVTAGAALGGAGFMAYQLYNGFGLKGSAAALDAAAAHLMGVGGPGGVAGKAAAAGVAAEAGLPGALAIPGAIEVGAGVLAFGGAAALTGLVKEAFDAQQPGKGGQWAAATADTRVVDQQRMEAQQEEADRLRAEIARNEARSRIAGGADAINLPLKDQLAEKLNQIENLRRSLVDLDAVASPEARAGRALMGLPKPEEFGPNLPPYIDREAERGRAYQSLRAPEQFGPAAPAAAPAAPQVDPASATDALFTLGSLSEETGAKMQTALSVTATPVIDTGSINAAQAAAERLAATLGQIGALAASASAAVAGASAGGANAAVSARRSFNRAPAGAVSV